MEMNETLFEYHLEISSPFRLSKHGKIMKVPHKAPAGFISNTKQYYNSTNN